MAAQPIRLNHSLFARLLEVDQEAERLFPKCCDQGLGNLGLRLTGELDSHRYSSCTPLNCCTFADTGGEGVHFSFLVRDGAIDEGAPVVVTVPRAESYIVGESLFDFLCLGYYRGYYALEELGNHRKLTLQVFTDPDWHPSEDWHYSVGYGISQQDDRMLAWLVGKLGLRPWPDASRYGQLQRRFRHLLRMPNPDSSAFLNPNAKPEWGPRFKIDE